MKTNVFFKAVCVAVVMVATTAMVKANNSYATNDVMNGQQVETRFVYQKDNQTLSYYMKHEFTYDQENRLASKETFQWNSSTEEWVLRSKTQYTHNGWEILVEADRSKQSEKNDTTHMQYSFRDINSLALAKSTR
ncbi:MAG: DUF3836 domain-containing protein [Bacteroides sp.]|nr:DUF3836 domain-containing protein [Bacteroides sp.]